VCRTRATPALPAQRARASESERAGRQLPRGSALCPPRRLRRPFRRLVRAATVGQPPRSSRGRAHIRGCSKKTTVPRRDQKPHPGAPSDSDRNVEPLVWRDTPEKREIGCWARRKAELIQVDAVRYRGEPVGTGYRRVLRVCRWFRSVTPSGGASQCQLASPRYRTASTWMSSAFAWPSILSRVSRAYLARQGARHCDQSRSARRDAASDRDAATVVFFEQPEYARDRDYYEAVVRPLLREPGVEMVGEVDGADKVRFLGEAAALLFPIRWPSPLGW